MGGCHGHIYDIPMVMTRVVAKTALVEICARQSRLHNTFATTTFRSPAALIDSAPVAAHVTLVADATMAALWFNSTVAVQLVDSSSPVCSAV